MDRKAVLVLPRWNNPVIIDYNGDTNNAVNIEFGKGTSVQAGCGTTLNGEFWYFGGIGSDNIKQVILLLNMVHVT